MFIVLHAIVAAAFSLLSGSSAPAQEKTRTRWGSLVWLHLVGTGGWVGRSHVGAAPMLFFRSDCLWSTGIRLVLAPALPNKFAAQTAPSGPPTSSMAGRATLERRPAPSLMYIFPYAVVTVALSHLAGFTPLASRPCMHRSGDRAGRGWSIVHMKRRAGAFCRIDHARLRGVQASVRLSGWSLP